MAELVLAAQLDERQFADGAAPPVYCSVYDRQYALDDDGEPVYGVWLHPDEYQEPITFRGRFRRTRCHELVTTEKEFIDEESAVRASSTNGNGCGI